MNNTSDKYCYLCEKKLVNTQSELKEENTTLDHQEHIFQQAIGGTLKTKGILCSNCGGILGLEVDVPFIKQFNNIKARLFYYKDRNNIKEKKRKKKKKSKSNAKSDDGIVDFMGKKIAVNIEGVNVYPKKPIFFKKDDIIFVLMKNSTPIDYVEKKVKPNFPNISDTQYKIITNLQDYCDATYLEHNINNKAFKQGFAKIAIGFSTYKGIQAKCLNTVLDIKEKKIKDDLIIVTYFPTTIIEKCIEEFRFLTGNPESLFHSIKLKNFGKNLIAYIEIFGTYQVSILLSDCYEGEDIYETYTQPLFRRKSEKILQYIPTPKNYQIDYEYKLSDETKSKMNLMASGEELKEILSLMNSDILKYHRNEEINFCIDKYYQDLLELLYRILLLLKQPKQPSIYKKYIDFINETFPKLHKCKRLLYKSLWLVQFFIKNPQLFKYLTCIKDQQHFVLYANAETTMRNNDLIKKYLEKKLEELEVFINKYQRGILREGRWEIYSLIKE